MQGHIDVRLTLAHDIAASYAPLPEVEAVALAGSLTSGAADARSDLDLYVYTREEVPLQARLRIAGLRGVQVELDNRFFEPGDEWLDGPSGAHVDVMFREVGWIEAALARVLDRHEASVGYTTCLWHSVLSATLLADRAGWLARLQARQPYPEPLRRAIVARNHPLLRRNLSSYLTQLELAVARGDRVSVNHRLAAILASVFDVLFAVNRRPHPGEKRLLALAEAGCPLRPPNLAARVEAVLAAGATADPQVITLLHALLDDLDGLLRTETLLQET
jgi:predicted nucleotidyltransferase